MILTFKKLLVVPLKPEWAHLKQKYNIEKHSDFSGLFILKNNPDTALLQIGCGLERAKNSLNDFFNRFSCEQVLHFGSCGALTENLKTGDLVVAGDLINFLHHSKINFVFGKIFSSQSVLKNSAEKKACAQKHNALAVDMESFSVLEICQKNQIPCLVVRSVFDELKDDLENLGEPYDSAGNLAGLKIAASLIKSPKLILQLPHLQKKSARVNRQLARVVEWFVKELG